jgi:lipopolysaccharide/colanic/teichoic acid biosynthesis glycosyltransferase
VRTSGVTVKSDEEQKQAANVSEEYEPITKHGFKYRLYLAVKRTADFMLAFVALITLLPLIAIILLVKWLEDFHNPIYVSKRVGKDGKLFHFYKIRSMRPDAELLKQKMIEEGLNEVDGPAFKMKNDPRITPVGRFLRRSSLDELLQLYNIVKGDMSIVGPRPPLPFEVDTYTAYQRHRLDVKGGLLCLWQIQPNRHDVSFDDWVNYDIDYIRNQSLILDLKIICKGAFMVFSGKSGD